MIETLMALWNRGVSGRLVVMVVTFFCVCISISLLFVTVGSIWGSLLAHKRTGGEETHMVNSVLITAVASTPLATSGVEATPTMLPNPCLASPTESRGYTRQANATRGSGQSSVPTTGATATSVRLPKTPTPGLTVTPKPEPSPTPSPTPPAVTPTVLVTPTATTLPAVTPTAISTPTVTPTPVVTPTLPSSTPTTGIVPTNTATSNVTPTVTGTAPAGTPTVTLSATPGIGSRHIHDGRPPTSGTPASGNNGQSGTGNCFSDNLVASGEGAVLSLLQNFFWVILVSSLLGTALFCAQMYRLSRNFKR